MPSNTTPRGHLRLSDARAIAQLATQATIGVSRIAEGVHQSVWETVGVAGGSVPGHTGGITGLVYQAVRGVTSLVGRGIDVTASSVQRMVGGRMAVALETAERAAVLAALNGVLGDHLVATNNSLATPMALRHCGEVLNHQNLPRRRDVTGKVLLLVHGLCMNDLQWRTHHRGGVVDHGKTLASEHGYTPIYLRYNTGLQTSENGRALASLMAWVVANWPMPVEEIAIVAHSMGGLVARSAVHYARQDARAWTDSLKHMVFLGTPHHGVPLEKAGNWVGVVLGSTPYTAPFAKLAQLRSAGITDLRFGHVVDEDWQGNDCFERKPDDRPGVPLPDHVACHAVAATTAAERGLLCDHVVGDGLVPLNSALGHHEKQHRRLAFASQWIAYRTNHLALLGRPEVGRQLVRWLKPAAAHNQSRWPPPSAPQFKDGNR